MIVSYDDLEICEIELTSECGAGCPQCPRNIFGGETVKDLPICELSLEDIKTILPVELIKRLNLVYFCGTYGDPIWARELLPVIKWLREVNSSLEIGLNTNGAARTEKWWSELAEVLSDNGYISFSIDGLEDTNHIYRRWLDYNKVIRNAKSFIKSGGNAVWEFLVFKHNEHQVEDIEKLSKELGFQKFTLKKTARFLTKDHIIIEKQEVLDKEGNIEYYLEKPEESKYRNVSMEKIDKIIKENNSFDNHLDELSIKCHVKAKKEIYISAEGLVVPCGWLHDRMYGQYVKDSKSSKQFWDMINDTGGKDKLDAKKHSIKEIVEGDLFRKVSESWTKEKIKSGKMERCAVMCGQGLDVLKNQANKIYRYESYENV
jgi:MoaA/NifB/PqqE/SkfB family radical SAM enzyme